MYVHLGHTLRIVATAYHDDIETLSSSAPEALPRASVKHGNGFGNGNGIGNGNGNGNGIGNLIMKW